jgi:hypothetical protein
VGYSGKDGKIGRYHCRGAAINHGAAGQCISFGSLRIDQSVSAVDGFQNPPKSGELRF